LQKPQDSDDALKTLNALATRCTGSAWELLKTHRDHPVFPALLARLHQKRGSVLEYDVERVFNELLTVTTDGPAAEDGTR
jgi:hypothetical protein